MVLPNYVTEREPERLGLAMKPIDDLLSEMMARNASDLHIKAGSPPVIRVDGELALLDEPPLTPEDTKDVAASIMTDKQIRRFSEHNEIDFAYSAANLGRFRVNVFRQRGSISVAMRQVTTKIPSFEELHLPDIIKRLALEPRGLVLVTGTTGSGKTTTLAAMIDHINNTMRRHIVTVEDPIEVLHKDKKSIINQREIGLDTDSYATALKYVLRQDPDDILIGEMRDTRDGRGGAHRRPDRPLRDEHAAHHRRAARPSTASSTSSRCTSRSRSASCSPARSRASSASACSCAPTARAACRPSRSWCAPTASATSSSTRTSRCLITDAIKEGDFYGMQTFDQALLSLYEDGLITLADAAQVASNPHDFKLLVQSQGHDVSLMTF